MVKVENLYAYFGEDRKRVQLRAIVHLEVYEAENGQSAVRCWMADGNGPLEDAEKAANFVGYLQSPSWVDKPLSGWPSTLAVRMVLGRQEMPTDVDVMNAEFGAPVV